MNVDVTEGMRYGHGQRVVYVLTQAEVDALVQRHTEPLYKELRKFRGTARKRELRAGAEPAVKPKRVLVPRSEARRQQYRVNSLKRYARYRELCVLANEPVRGGNWGAHLAVLDRRYPTFNHNESGPTLNHAGSVSGRSQEQA